MGLDMYLTRKIGTRNWDFDGSPKWQITVTKNGEPIQINVENISSVTEEIGYWRKANAIHNWFVKNVQGGTDDCGEYYVSKDKLEELQDVCRRVLDNPELSKELLPTGSGFFFGSTEYDDWYLDALRSAIDYCEYALSTDIGEVYYQSSW